MPGVTFEEGLYNATITSWWLGESKEKRTPYVAFRFVPTNQVEGEGVSKCPPFERTIYRYLTENSMPYVAQDLERLGYDRDSFDYLDPDHPQAFNFLNKVVQVRCEHEEYNNEWKERWNFDWGRGGRESAVKLERQDIAKLNALYGSQLKGQAATKPTTTPPRVSNTSTKRGRNEEVPF